MLARLEAGEIVRLRSFTPECDIDAGGLPLIWLTDLKPAELAKHLSAGRNQFQAWLSATMPPAPEG